MPRTRGTDGRHPGRACTCERAWVVHGAAGWDEATPIGPFLAFDVAGERDPGRSDRSRRISASRAVRRTSLSGGDAPRPMLAALLDVFERPRSRSAPRRAGAAVRLRSAHRRAGANHGGRHQCGAQGRSTAARREHGSRSCKRFAATAAASRARDERLPGRDGALERERGTGCDAGIAGEHWSARARRAPASAPLRLSATRLRRDRGTQAAIAGGRRARARKATIGCSA